jgi:hypothetical protein
MNARSVQVATEALFRVVNERLEGVNEAFALMTEDFAIVCECGDRTCSIRSSSQPLTMDASAATRRYSSRSAALRRDRQACDGEVVAGVRFTAASVSRRPDRPRRGNPTSSRRRRPGESSRDAASRDSSPLSMLSRCRCGVQNSRAASKRLQDTWRPSTAAPRLARSRGRQIADPCLSRPQQLRLRRRSVGLH